MQMRLRDFIVTYFNEHGEEDVGVVQAYTNLQAEFLANSEYHNIIDIEDAGFAYTMS